MTALPPRPTSQRGWSVVGFFHPRRFGRDTTSLLFEVGAITFRRLDTSSDGRGGFAGSEDGPVAYLTCPGHAEIHEVTDYRGATPTVTPIVRRFYTVIIDTPPTVEQIPKRNDRIAFTDVAGRTVDMVIEDSIFPQNDPGHVEIRTLEFE